MIAIIDYGVGNLFSLTCSLRSIGQDVTVTGDIDIISKADKIILPGVGAFSDARKKLSINGLDKTVVTLAKSGKPLMGICLGMQMLFDKSYEFGEYEGLGLIHGKVVAMRDLIPAELKIPQIGWNGLNITKDTPLFKGIKNGDCVYFVHSFCAVDCNSDLIATTEYGAEITAAVQKENIIGCQFHPEKSGNVGLTILKNFCEMEIK